MAAITYNLSTKAVRGRAEVLVRFYHSRLNLRAKSGILVPSASWDAAAGRMAIPRKPTNATNELRAINAQLDALSDYIYTAYTRDRLSLPPDWLPSVIRQFHSASSATVTIPTLEQLCRDYATRYHYNTAKGIMGIANHVRTFCRKPVLVSQVTPQWCQQFADYLGVTNTNNSVVSKMHRLRSILNYAVDCGYIRESPIGRSGYKAGQEVYTSPFYLSIEERDAIAATPLSGTLAVQRDIFIFQCHIGCRVSDLRTLTHANIYGDWLQYVPAKTIGEKAATVRVPLSDIAKAIIARYAPTIPLPSTPLLPFITDQAYNRSIHEIVRLSGIDRQVMVLEHGTGKPVLRPLYEVASSHMARRTFAANIYTCTGGNERVTASMTGHSPGSKAFLRYTEVNDDLKMQAIMSVCRPSGVHVVQP